MKENDTSEFIKKFIKPFMFDQVRAFIFLTLYSAGNIIIPYYMKLIVDEGIGKVNIQNILLYTGFMVGTIVLTLLFHYLQTMKFVKLGQKIVFEIKKTIMGKLTKYSMTFFRDYQSGEMVSIIENDVKEVENLATYVISDCLVNIFSALGLFAMLFIIDAEIAGVAILLVLIYMLIQKSLGKLIKKKSTDFTQMRGEVYSATQEFISGLNHIKMLNCEKYFQDKYSQKHQKYFRDERSLVGVRTYSKMIGVAFQSLGTILVLCFGGYKVINNQLTLGILFSLIIYIQRIFNPIVALTNSYVQIKKTQANLKRVWSMISNEAQEITDGHMEHNTGLKGDIAFRNLSFGYGDKLLFMNINFQINRGEKIALIGKNGSGKTSIIRLLMRMLKNYSGQILIDNENIEKYKLDYLKENIICIGQEPFVFNGTIKENILLSDGEISDEELNTILKRLCLKDDIDNMPEGINTVVGEKGLALSGGQAQKIALARVFVRKPSIIILDEPTSALDVKAEEEICKYIFEYFKDQTVIVITHREQILNYCTKIYALENNSLKEVTEGCSIHKIS